MWQSWVSSDRCIKWDGNAAAAAAATTTAVVSAGLRNIRAGPRNELVGRKGGSENRECAVASGVRIR